MLQRMTVSFVNYAYSFSESAVAQFVSARPHLSVKIVEVER
jgi:hypothetical protein